MPDSAQPSPLTIAALAVIGDGATADDLAARLGEAGAELQPDVAVRLLEASAHLGLVRAARGSGRRRRYVLTSIGQRRLQDSLSGGGTEADRLEELETLRTDLLSTIAHELRTPLTAVRTSVGLLQDTQREPDAGQRQTLLATIERNAVRMQRLIDDILELARFRSGSISLQLRRFDARRMAEAALASIAPQAEAARQRLVFDASSPHAAVYGDHRRLEQALVNLLSNAQKFSPPGGAIEVRVEQADGEVRWHVTDHGPGIEAADRARLFERFFVGRNDRSGSSSGIGLGLPTTLAIAQAHGGRVEVHSRPGRGSTFVLAVPTEAPDAENDE
jgi:signal transduction histidine kinase